MSSSSIFGAYRADGLYKKGGVCWKGSGFREWIKGAVYEKKTVRLAGELESPFVRGISGMSCGEGKYGSIYIVVPNWGRDLRFSSENEADGR